MDSLVQAFPGQQEQPGQRAFPDLQVRPGREVQPVQQAFLGQQAFRGQRLLRRGIEQHATVETGDAIGHTANGFQVMLDPQHGNACGTPVCEQAFEHLNPGFIEG